MHVVVKPRPDETLTIKLHDGRCYRITFRDSAAHVPEPVGRYLIEKGFAVQGSEPNPKPQFEALPGGGWGNLLPMFDPWVKEITAQPEEK